MSCRLLQPQKELAQDLGLASTRLKSHLGWAMGMARTPLVLTSKSTRSWSSCLLRLRPQGSQSMGRSFLQHTSQNNLAVSVSSWVQINH